jgi:hypothetical protein
MKESISNALETLYTPQELATIWKMHRSTIQRMLRMSLA